MSQVAEAGQAANVGTAASTAAASTIPCDGSKVEMLSRSRTDIDAFRFIVPNLKRYLLARQAIFASSVALFFLLRCHASDFPVSSCNDDSIPWMQQLGDSDPVVYLITIV